MQIAIYARPANVAVAAFTARLIESLLEKEVTPIVHETLLSFINQQTKTELTVNTFSHSKELASNHIDFLMSIGGDGTLLDTVTLIERNTIPVVGINVGRLGFLANIQKDDIDQTIDALLKGQYALDKRTLLRLESDSNLFGKNNYALNELTIHKKDSASMMTIHTYLNGEFLNSYWADGLIIATPTGSTAYSLSCGGPILVPQSESFVITPIAPHNLNVRPVIVPDSSIISIEIEGRSPYYMASLDSRSYAIDASVQLAIRKEDFTIDLVRLHSQHFLETLRKKLMWGLDSRN